MEHLKKMHYVLGSSAVVLVLITSLFGFQSCGDDDGSEAIQRGVGSECTTNDDCTEAGQRCLTQFKGGYCGIEGCQQDEDCPQGSVCVAHDDGNNYCFLICTEKPQCNVNRSEENESNCSSSVTFVEEHKDLKACVPPSGQ